MFDMEDIKAGEKRPVRITFKATGTESLELKIRTRAEGTNVIKETTADKVEVAVKEADLSFKSLGTEEAGDLISSDMFRENAIAKFEITANRNYQLEELKNAKVKIKVEGNVEVDGIEKDDDDPDVKITKVNDNSNEYEISNITLNRGKSFNIRLKTGEVSDDDEYSTKVFDIKSEIFNEKGELIDSHDFTGYVVKPKLTMEQSVDKNKTYLEEGEVIEYTYKVANVGLAPSYTHFVFNAPEGSRILSEEGAINTVEKDLNLEPFEEREIKIKVEIGKNNGVDRVSISANAELYDEDGEQIYETNPITQIVEKNSDTRRKEDLVRQGKLQLSDEEIKSLGIQDVKKEDEKLVRNYEITGKAWDDTNKNGVYDEDERPLANVIAKLVDNSKNRIIKTVLTNEDGSYIFTEVPNGEYSVMFEYETQKYSPTVYKKNNVQDNVTSDAISINRQDEGTKQVAVSDGIKIDFQSKSDENLGLVNNNTFNMSLKGEVTKLKLVNGDNKNDITDKKVDKTVNKFKVSPFTSGNSNVEVEYKLKVVNEGNVPGKITKIGAYLSNDEKLVEGQNWKLEHDGLASSRQLENEEIEPGQEKEITISIATTMDKVMDKVLSNRFEILETSNNLGVKDINSVEGNNSTNEDDNVMLDVIVNKDFTIIFVGIFAAIAAVGIAFRDKIKEFIEKLKKDKNNKNTNDKDKEKEDEVRKGEANDKQE